MSEVDLQERLAFMSFDAANLAALATLKPVIDKTIDDALGAFYGKIRSTPQLKSFFRDEAQIEGARKRQGEHWQRLFSGKFDEGYAKAVRTIGSTHARIGLEPRWYVGGYALIAEKLVHSVVANSLNSMMSRLQNDPKALAGVLGAMVKAIMLDMELAISIYIEALDDERRKAEEAREREAALQTHALDALAKALAEMARGNLTDRLDDDLAPEFAAMRENYNKAITTLEEAMSSISNSASRIEMGNAEIARAADELSTRTERQAAGLEESTAAVDHLTGRVKQTSANADNAMGIISKATGNAEAASSVLDGMKNSMSEIQKSTSEIGTITDAMDEIAFQTNLLALNAGVEAARAGESGKGFAVVAQEVRQLAQRAAESAKTIKRLIGSATEKVTEGVGYVTRTDETVRGFISQFHQINTVITEIAEAAREQAQGLSEVNIAISDMDINTQQNAAMVEQTTAATHALSQDARSLAESVRFFQVTPMVAPVRAAPAPQRAVQMRSTGSAQRKPAAENWTDF